MRNRASNKILASIMKRRFLSISLAICMISTLLPTMALAGDYEDHWAAPYIEKCHERGWMAGDGNGNFRPDDPITRGEFSVMLWRALGRSDERIPAAADGGQFSDVTEEMYYYQAVNWLAANGIVFGYGNGLFGPNDTLTREMAFVMLARAFDLKPVSAGEAAEYTTFDDYTEVSSWATDAASILILKGYVEGSDGKLAPKKALTRGEMAKLLVTVYDGEQNEPLDDNAPVITLRQSPTASTYGNVKISISVESKHSAAFIGWRSSSSGATYSDKTGFTDITSAKEFSVGSNGWYAVCAVDALGHFAYKLIQITNIQTSSGGGGGGTTYYTVDFEGNGGEPVPESQRLVRGSKALMPADPTKAGYTFAGWYKEDGLINLWDFDTDTVTSNITLYAKWLLKHTITMTDDGNGTASADPESAALGTTVTVKARAVAGYMFKEWVIVRGDVTLSSTAASTATFAMPDEPVEIRATFEQLPVITSLKLYESNGGTTAAAPFEPDTDTMFIRGGTTVSSAERSNAEVGGGYSASTVYLLYDGAAPLREEYCAVLEIINNADVTGEFIAVDGYAALRVTGNPTASDISGSFDIYETRFSILPLTIYYTIVPSPPPQAYAVYMVAGSISVDVDVQAFINNSENNSDVTKVAEYEQSGSGWSPVGSSTATMLEQRDAWFVVAAQYERGGRFFVGPLTPVAGWHESVNSGQGTVFDGTSQAFAGNAYIKGQIESAGGGITQALTVDPQLGSGGGTVTAITKVGAAGATADLPFHISVTPRSVERYEFREANGDFLADSRVPIGTSRSFQIYAVYNNSINEPVDFGTTNLTVTYTNPIAFPAADNPSGLASGNLLTVTATSDGGSNDLSSGTTCTVRVTDGAGRYGENTLTLGNSQIKGLTYYVETPGGIEAYDDSGPLQRTFSAAELTSARGGVLEIPRGLDAKVWVVPVFTNATMYDAATAGGDWINYAVTSAGFSGTTGGGGSLPQPQAEDDAFVLSAAGNLRIDINDPITADFAIDGSVMVNGRTYALAPAVSSGVNTSFTVKITEPVAVALDVEQWNGSTYVSIYNGSGYELTGNVGDELRLRVKVVYSDGGSVDALGRNHSGTYAGGVYFLPRDNLNTYNLAVGPTPPPTTVSDFSDGKVHDLGVLYGYFMSHYPAAYSALVNPPGGTPTAGDWNNNKPASELQSILEDLTRQIGLHEISGDAGGLAIGYLAVLGGGDIVPGHFSLTLNQAGSYTLGFSGAYQSNGYTDLTAVNGISSNSPLVINLTVTDMP